MTPVLTHSQALFGGQTEVGKGNVKPGHIHDPVSQEFDMVNNTCLYHMVPLLFDS